MNVRLAREIVYARSDWVCERCGRRRATNWHHRRSAGRVWSPENGLHLCGSGTTLCHGWVTGHPEISRDFGWVVRSTGDPLWMPVLVFGQWVYLTRDGQKVPVRDTSNLPEITAGFPDLAA